jgi:hypothetical protein
MLRHLVLLRFKPEATAAQVGAVVQAFVELPAQISEVKSLEWGTDVSPEGLGKGFTHCFALGFDNARGRDDYLPHPAHQAFVAQLQPVLADVLVVDYETPGA